MRKNRSHIEFNKGDFAAVTRADVKKLSELSDDIIFGYLETVKIALGMEDNLFLKPLYVENLDEFSTRICSESDNGSPVLFKAGLRSPRNSFDQSRVVVVGRKVYFFDSRLQLPGLNQSAVFPQVFLSVSPLKGGISAAKSEIIKECHAIGGNLKKEVEDEIFQRHANDYFLRMKTAVKLVSPDKPLCVVVLGEKSKNENIAEYLQMPGIQPIPETNKQILLQEYCLEQNEGKDKTQIIYIDTPRENPKVVTNAKQICLSHSDVTKLYDLFISVEAGKTNMVIHCQEGYDRAPMLLLAFDLSVHGFDHIEHRINVIRDSRAVGALSNTEEILHAIYLAAAFSCIRHYRSIETKLLQKEPRLRGFLTELNECVDIASQIENSTLALSPKTSIQRGSPAMWGKKKHLSAEVQTEELKPPLRRNSQSVSFLDLNKDIKDLLKLLKKTLQARAHCERLLFKRINPEALNKASEALSSSQTINKVTL